MTGSGSVRDLQAKLFRQLGVDSQPTFGRKKEAKARREKKSGPHKSFVGPRAKSADESEHTTGHYPVHSGFRNVDHSEEEEEEVLDLACSRKRKRAEDDSHAPAISHVRNEPDGNAGPGRTGFLSDALFAADDADIAEYERKLGIRKRKKVRPPSPSFGGLEEILEGLGGLNEPLTGSSPEYQNWLDEKRNGSGRGVGYKGVEDHENDDATPFFSGNIPLPGDTMDEPELDPATIGGASGPGIREKQNPYRAPSIDGTPKYVPPSRRSVATGEPPALDRLRKKLQGLVNRLTDANMLSVVQSIEELYRSNARGDVTSVLVDLLMAQVCKPEALPDPFFVLAGGFMAAIYKIVGTSFGSHLLRRLAAGFKTAYARQSEACAAGSAQPREASNLISLLAELYVFDVVGSRLLLDYTNLLLLDLSEASTELLLRIVRMAGRALRRDSPHELKSLVGSLNRTVTRKEMIDNLTLRTRYLIDAINELNANKGKASGGDSVVVSEHVQRMKRRLGELKAQSWRRLDGTTAIGVSLRDLEAADADGKWWLVGASVPDKKRADAAGRSLSPSGGGGAGAEVAEGTPPDDDENMGLLLPDYPGRAREQGLSTNAQIAIFTALMSASDADHGYRQFLALKLRPDDRREISRVLIQCAGSEATYNPYYTMVAKQACAVSKYRFAFQDRLWDIFRRLGEPLFGDDEAAPAEDVLAGDKKRIAHVSRLFGTLVADTTLPITILKPLDLYGMRKTTRTLVEGMLQTVLRRHARLTADDRSSAAAVENVFGPANQYPALAMGISSVLQGFREQSGKLDEVLASVRAILHGEFVD